MYVGSPECACHRNAKETRRHYKIKIGTKIDSNVQRTANTLHREWSVGYQTNSWNLRQYKQSLKSCIAVGCLAVVDFAVEHSGTGVGNPLLKNG